MKSCKTNDRWILKVAFPTIFDEICKTNHPQSNLDIEEVFFLEPRKAEPQEMFEGSKTCLQGMTGCLGV